MRNSAVGVMNGNSKIREYVRGLQEARKNPDLCANCKDVKSLPMYLASRMAGALKGEVNRNWGTYLETGKCHFFLPP